MAVAHTQEYVRNVGILASIDAGRTTTSERILAVTGGGSGVAASGSLALDLDRSISQTSAATSCLWGRYRINLVDLMPIDRGLDERVLSVLDGVILVLDAEAGVTEEVCAALRHLAALKIACAVFVNKLDRTDAALEEIGAAIDAVGAGKALLVQVPVGGGTGLTGLVDLVTLRLVSWSRAGGQIGPVPDGLMDVARRSRNDLARAVGQTVEVDAYSLKQAVTDSVRQSASIPVLGGSAFRNRGIDGLLDAIVDYLPCPGAHRFRVVGIEGQPVDRNPAANEHFAAFAFDAVSDQGAGRLTFVRIYSGVLEKGGAMLNSVSATQEHIQRMVRMLANKTEDVDRAEAGDIVALAGLINTEAGDTLCDPVAPVILKRLSADEARPKIV